MIAPAKGQLCTVNESCTAVVATVTGGVTPYTYSYGSLGGGTTPWGMGVNVADTMNNHNEVVLTGIPNQTGIYNFQVCVQDGMGIYKCTNTDLTVNNPPPTGQCLPISICAYTPVIPNANDVPVCGCTTAPPICGYTGPVSGNGGSCSGGIPCANGLICYANTMSGDAAVCLPPGSESSQNCPM